MVRTVISMNSIDQALRDAHDARDDHSGHPVAFREVYDQWTQFRAAQLKAVLAFLAKVYLKVRAALLEISFMSE